ncbi:SIS domain-containing protein [Candidatus Pelagibacter sp.]|jgi:D-sedoheptulose 7-phosphate isomerase|nr:SIS domain-containing protein [Candidatus Pelagibacter sp.]
MLRQKIQNHCKVIKSLEINEKKIKSISTKIANQIIDGGKLLFCGNGGSAADSQHLAAEFLVRLRPNINRRPIAALSLATDVSTLTACANDYSSNEIFLRTFLALKKENDILFVITTSGKSKNIIKVLKEAKKQKIYSVGLLGKGGGDAKKITDDSIIVKSNNTALIQESHIFLGHYILETVENELLKKKFI